MGTCVSIHRNPESAMKIRLSLGSKSKKLFAPPSPASTERSTGEEKGVAQFDPETKKVGPMFGFLASSPPIGSSRDFGSKDETFFDTQAWLDSDCEDDFLSVNGEFTPSRGSTPYNQRSAPGTPQINKALFLERISDPKVETSPTDKKKKLSDLFKESLRNELVIDQQNVASGKLEVNNAHLNILTKSSDGTLYASGTNSVCSSERTPNKATRPEKERKAKAAQCCLPSLVQNFSFSERKKHLSPAHLNGG